MYSYRTDKSMLKEEKMKREKVMLERVSVCVLLILVSMLYLASSAPAQKTFHLKYSGQWTQDNLVSYPANQWFKEVEKRTGGRVKVTPYHAESLGKAETTLDMLSNGVCDMAGIAHGYFPSVFRVTDFVGLPFLMPNQAIGTEQAYVLENSGLLAKDLKGLKVLWWEAVDPAYLIFRNKKVTSLEELKGMKIRTVPGVPIKTLEALGATPVGLPGGETYMALERGVVEGLTTSPSAISMRKYQEVTKYCLWFPLYGGLIPFAMTQDKWNSFPPEIQAIMTELNIKAKYDFLYEMQRIGAGTPQSVEKLGLQVIRLSPQEEARWVSVVQGVYDQWIKDLEAKGLPGREAVDLAKRIAKLYMM